MYEIKSGIKGLFIETVEFEKTAKHYGSGSLEVFATPAMIAGMEKTCMDSVQPFLEEGDTTVGTYIQAEHLKASPLKSTIKYESEITEISGREIIFSVNAFDEKGIIGKAIHKRYIVNINRFLQKL